MLDRADSDDFYPRPPRGGRPLFQSVGDSFRQFLSTPSARRATSALYSRPPASKFLSTPSARRATQRADTALDARQNFYPRPPRGGRRDRLLYPHQRRAISIHALREEGDLPFCPASSRRGQFLSTPSARRATCPVPSSLSMTMISIHALREEGDTSAGITYTASTISIHALREEGDQSPTR